MEVACWKQLAQCVESTTCQSQTGLPTELPNYNLPPTYACMDSIYDYTTKLSSSNPTVEKNGQNCGQSLPELESTEEQSFNLPQEVKVKRGEQNLPELK